MRRTAADLLLAWSILLGPAADAQTKPIPVAPGHVKVTVEFRQEGRRAQSGVEVRGRGPGGTVIRVDPRDVTGPAGVQVQESARSSRQRVESFLLVRDGGEARLAVVEEVPEVAWFHQYALGRRYITAAVVFRQVGTYLAVRPTILPDQRIRVRITPRISYRGDQGDGTIELVEASTEVVVARGQPITIGGADRGGEVIRQFLLGYEQVHQANQVSIVLTAE